MRTWLVAHGGESNPTDNVETHLWLCERCVPPIRQPLETCAESCVCANCTAPLSDIWRVVPCSWHRHLSAVGKWEVRTASRTTIGGTADGSRRSTRDTLNMGPSAGTGVTLACGSLPGMSPPAPPPLTMAHGYTALKHMGSHGVHLRVV